MCKFRGFKLQDYGKLILRLKLCFVFKHEFKYDMDCFWQSVQNESCFFMSLECAIEISTHLVEYNFIYGTFSISTPVLSSLQGGYHILWKTNDFGKVFNMKVVED